MYIHIIYVYTYVKIHILNPLVNARPRKVPYMYVYIHNMYIDTCEYIKSPRKCCCKAKGKA